jgi:outer membrane biosynthesis protein TonB
MDDLRILVAGFVDLAKAATAPVSEPVRDPEPPASRVAGQAAQAPGGAGSGYTAPVAVRQDLPRWTPPNPSIGARAYEGAVKVSIGADGHVQDVSMVAPVHPMYDPLVLQAARRWVYRPATRLGEPAPSEKVVEIRLAPR